MRRNIPLLSGLAILAVVFNHANWHILSQFGPGDPAGTIYLFFDQVGKFAIAAFLFTAGYFIAYATDKGASDLRWSVMQARLVSLVIPWLLWSAFLTLAGGVVGRPISAGKFVSNLLIQYYFVPLLILYYLMAGWLVRSARKNPRATVLSAAGIQLAAMALFYARLYLPGFPEAAKFWVDEGPLQYLRFALYFPMGLIVGIGPTTAKSILTRFKSTLPWLTLLLFIGSVGETEIAYNRGGGSWPIGADQSKLSSVLFSLALILCFVAFDRIILPFDRWISRVGAYTYGIYLMHYFILGLLARVIAGYLPWVTMQPWLLLPLLLALTVAVSLLLITITAHTPIRLIYAFLFG
jgi:probable poly-beta-1,6-N-acetyl-D-glucosamine export protein